MGASGGSKTGGEARQQHDSLPIHRLPRDIIKNWRSAPEGRARVRIRKSDLGGGGEVRLHPVLPPPSLPFLTGQKMTLKYFDFTVVSLTCPSI